MHLVLPLSTALCASNILNRTTTQVFSKLLSLFRVHDNVFTIALLFKCLQLLFLVDMFLNNVLMRHKRNQVASLISGMGQLLRIEVDEKYLNFNHRVKKNKQSWFYSLEPDVFTINCYYRSA